MSKNATCHTKLMMILLKPSIKCQNKPEKAFTLVTITNNTPMIRTCCLTR